MTKVISFRVSDDTYFRLKKLNTTFIEIFRPFASEVARKNAYNPKHTADIQTKKLNEYSDNNEIENIVDRLLDIIK